MNALGSSITSLGFNYSETLCIKEIALQAILSFEYLDACLLQYYNGLYLQNMYIGVGRLSGSYKNHK